MTIRHKIQMTIAAATFSFLGLTATAIDLKPESETPELGIFLIGLD